MELKPFTKEDWYGYAGCEERPGEPPLLGHIDYIEGTWGADGRRGADVVVDITGVSVICFADGPDDEHGDLIWQLDAPYNLGRTIAMLLPESSVGITRLEALGFKRIN